MLLARCGLLLSRAFCEHGQVRCYKNKAKACKLVMSTSHPLFSFSNSSEALSRAQYKTFRMIYTTSHNNFSSTNEIPTIGKDIVDYTEFERFRKDKSALLIDVRNPEELLNNGEIPNAINIPLPDIPNYFFGENSSFEEKFDMPLPKEADPIIVFCKIGKRSEMARQLLTKGSGKSCYTNVANYLGSFDEWSEKNVSGK